MLQKLFRNRTSGLLALFAILLLLVLLAPIGFAFLSRLVVTPEAAIQNYFAAYNAANLRGAQSGHWDYRELYQMTPSSDNHSDSPFHSLSEFNRVVQTSLHNHTVQVEVLDVTKVGQWRTNTYYRVHIAVREATTKTSITLGLEHRFYIVMQVVHEKDTWKVSYPMGVGGL